jgi:orotidine-5'-phosphate decarboxylase
MAGAAYALGSAERAAQIFPHLIPYRSMIGYSGSTVEGALAHHLGTLSGLMGRVEESETYFAEALQLHERLRAPFFIARTRLEWGRMLLQPSSVQNLTRAEEHIRQAQGIAHEHGYDGIATSAAALMHQV